MSRIRIHHVNDAKWERVQDVSVPEGTRRPADEEMDASVCFHEPGTDTSPQLFEVNYLPGSTIQLHAHEEDEIIYILEGQMQLGNRILDPGSAVFVKGLTLYKFLVGPEGLRILNFRPRGDLTYIHADQFHEMQKQKKDA